MTELTIEPFVSFYGTTSPTSSFTISNAKPPFRIQMDSPTAYVNIHPDGKIEYGPDYTPDAAAKALWDAVGLERKART